MIYLDSSALVKLVHPEVESAQLGQWLDERRAEQRVSSALVEVEVPRALLRRAPGRLAAGFRLIGSISCHEVTIDIRAMAASLPDPLVRSLDAIHLATALEFGADVNAFVTYDQRLLEAATTARLPAVSPGLG